MENRDLQRLQIIEVLIGQPPQYRLDATISLWNQLATQIIAIIGDEGFNSLYARSVVITQATFPWLEAATPSILPESRFEDLKKNLQAQIPSQANSANKQLLVTLTGILASLIGEALTTRILKSSWSNDIAERANQQGYSHE